MYQAPRMYWYYSGDISLQHILATMIFSCVCTCREFVLATRLLEMTLRQVPSRRDLNIFPFFACINGKSHTYNHSDKYKNLKASTYLHLYLTFAFFFTWRRTRTRILSLVSWHLFIFLPVSRARGLDSWNKIVLLSEWYALSNDTDWPEGQKQKCVNFLPDHHVNN